MKLEPLSRYYANYQLRDYGHSYTRPNPNRAYIKLLKFIAKFDYCPTSEIWSSKEVPSVMNLPYLEAARFVDHYREGRNTFWKITDKGLDLIAQADNNAV